MWEHHNLYTTLAFPIHFQWRNDLSGYNVIQPESHYTEMYKFNNIIGASSTDRYRLPNAQSVRKCYMCIACVRVREKERERHSWVNAHCTGIQQHQNRMVWWGSILLFVEFHLIDWHADPSVRYKLDFSTQRPSMNALSLFPSFSLADTWTGPRTHHETKSKTLKRRPFNTRIFIQLENRLNEMTWKCDVFSSLNSFRSFEIILKKFDFKSSGTNKR